MTETMTQFLDGLQASRLLEAERIDELLRRPEPPAGDVDGVSHFLVAQGWLTRFQIDEIRQGRGQELRIENYKLLERLPDRQSGRQYRALDTRTGTPVMLRLVNPDWLRPADDVAGYLDRARAVGRLAHANQVNVIDAGLAGDTPYLVLEYVDGASLANLVNEMGPLPVELACDYARQSALALQNAHEHGIFHGDFSPARMILAPVIHSPAGGGNGQKASTRPAPGASIKVEDIGLVPRRPPAAQISIHESHMLGSLHYLAPERFTSSEPTARGDIYSLGASLYFLLTGRPPSVIDFSVDSLTQMQQGSSVRIDSLRKDVSPALAELIHRLLAVDVNARPSSTGSVVQYLWPFTQYHAAPELIAAPNPSAANALPEAQAVDALPEAEVVDEPTVEPFGSHSDFEHAATGSLAFHHGSGADHEHDMFADDPDPKKPARPRRQKEEPPKKRWGMIILAVALHVVAFGVLALYLLKAGPFADSSKDKKPEIPKSRPHR